MLLNTVWRWKADRTKSKHLSTKIKTRSPGERKQKRHIYEEWRNQKKSSFIWRNSRISFSRKGRKKKYWPLRDIVRIIHIYDLWHTNIGAGFDQILAEMSSSLNARAFSHHYYYYFRFDFDLFITFQNEFELLLHNIHTLNRVSFSRTHIYILRFSIFVRFFLHLIRSSSVFLLPHTERVCFSLSHINTQSCNNC